MLIHVCRLWHSFLFFFFFVSIKCDLYINPRAVTPFFRFFNTFHCEAQLSACHLTFSTWTEITFHYFMNLVLVLNAFSAWHLHAHRKPRIFIPQSASVFIILRPKKRNYTFFFISLHYFVLYDDYFLVYRITDWMLLNVKCPRAVLAHSHWLSPKWSCGSKWLATGWPCFGDALTSTLLGYVQLSGESLFI